MGAIILFNCQSLSAGFHTSAVIALQAAHKNTRPNLSRLRQWMLFNYKKTPILYTPVTSSTTPDDLTLEHIVPVSVLKNTTAASDTQNIFLSCRHVNMARGNAKFCFDKPSKNAKKMGNGNHLDTSAGLFYPRQKDTAIIARAILGMARKWEFDWGKVTTATKQDLVDIVQKNKIHDKDLWHMKIAQDFNMKLHDEGKERK